MNPQSNYGELLFTALELTRLAVTGVTDTGTEDRAEKVSDIFEKTYKQVYALDYKARNKKLTTT